MTPLEIAAPAACIVIALTVSVVTPGWRGGLAAFAVAGARVGMIAIAAQLARWLGGDIAAWCSLPLLIAAVWFGDGPLGILNFLYLQWIGVRLARVTVPGLFTAVAIGNVRAGQAVTERDIDMRTMNPVVRWSLLRWVCPLTGWWSPRNPATCSSPCGNQSAWRALRISSSRSLAPSAPQRVRERRW